jgi:hypothetical protein
MEYKLTEQGKETCEWYIKDLKARRKDILDAGIDTVHDTKIPSIEEIDDDVNSEILEEDSYYGVWGVTDHYDAEHPLILTLGEDFIASYIE